MSGVLPFRSHDCHHPIRMNAQTYISQISIILVQQNNPVTVPGMCVFFVNK